MTKIFSAKIIKKILEKKEVLAVQNVLVTREAKMSLTKDRLVVSPLVKEAMEALDIKPGKAFIATPLTKNNIPVPGEHVINVADNATDDILILGSDMADPISGDIPVNRLARISYIGHVVRYWPNKSVSPMFLYFENGNYIPVNSKYNTETGTFTYSDYMPAGQLEEYVENGYCDIFAMFEHNVSQERKFQSIFCKLNGKSLEEFFTIHNKILSRSTHGSWELMVNSLVHILPYKDAVKVMARRNLPFTNCSIFDGVIGNFAIYYGKFAEKDGHSPFDGNSFMRKAVICRCAKQRIDSFEEWMPVTFPAAQGRSLMTKGHWTLVGSQDMETCIWGTANKNDIPIVFISKKSWYELGEGAFDNPEFEGKIVVVGTNDLTKVDAFVDKNVVKASMDLSKKSFPFLLMAFSPKEKGVAVTSNQTAMSNLPRGRVRVGDSIATGLQLHEELMRQTLLRRATRALEEKKSLSWSDIENINGYSDDLVMAISPTAALMNKKVRERYFSNFVKFINKAINGFSAEIEGDNLICVPDPAMLFGDSLINKREMFSNRVKSGVMLVVIFRHPKAGEGECSVLLDLSQDIILSRIEARENGEWRGLSKFTKRQADFLRRFYRGLRGRIGVFPMHDPAFPNRHGNSDSDGDSLLVCRNQKLARMLLHIPKQAVDPGKYAEKGRYCIMANQGDYKRILKSVEEVRALLENSQYKKISREEIEAIIEKAKKIFSDGGTIETINSNIVVSNNAESGNLTVGNTVFLVQNYVSLWCSILEDTINDDCFAEFCEAVKSPDESGRYRDGNFPAMSDLEFFNPGQKSSVMRAPYDRRIFAGKSVRIYGEHFDGENGIESVRGWYEYCASRAVYNTAQLELFVCDLISVMSSVLSRTIDSTKTGEPVFCPFRYLGLALRSGYAKGRVGINAVELIYLPKEVKVDVKKTAHGITYNTDEEGKPVGKPFWVLEDSALRFKNDMILEAKDIFVDHYNAVIDMIDGVCYDTSHLVRASALVADTLAKNYSFLVGSNNDAVKNLKEFYAATLRRAVFEELRPNGSKGTDVTDEEIDMLNIEFFKDEILAIARIASITTNGNDTGFYSIFGPELALEAIENRENPLPPVISEVDTVHEHEFEDGVVLHFEEGIAYDGDEKVYALDDIDGDYPIVSKNGKYFAEIDVVDFLKKKIVGSIRSNLFAIPLKEWAVVYSENGDVMANAAEQVSLFNQWATTSGDNKLFITANGEYGNAVYSFDEESNYRISELFMPGLYPRKNGEFNPNAVIANVINNGYIEPAFGAATVGEEKCYGVIGFKFIGK